MTIIFEIEQKLREFLGSEGCSTTVKILDKRLTEMGDLLIKSKTDADISFDVELLQKTSANWSLQVERVSFTGNVVHVWFTRPAAFRKAISSMEWEPRMKGTNGRSQQPYIYLPTIQGGDVISMTEFRANALRKFMQNCFAHAGYSMLKEDQLNDVDSSTLVKKISFVQHKVNNNIEHELNTPEREQVIEIMFGPVLLGADLRNASDYVKHRSNEMQLIGQHRYGVRIHDDNKLKRIVGSLGRSAAIVDVLQQKHSSTIDMRVGDTTRTPTATKGAVFILYNYARLVSIFKKHSKMIKEAGYPQVPLEGEVNFALLTEADEWNLLYVYVIGFPAALQRTLGDGQLERIAPHHLLEFTFGLVSCLSKYYRYTRILTDNRPKLLPVMVARLHLLKAILHILEIILNLLDLEPIEEM